MRCSSQLPSPLRSSVEAQELVGLVVNEKYFTPSARILWQWGLSDERISPQRLFGAAPAWQSHLSHRHRSYPLEMGPPLTAAPCPAPKGVGVLGIVGLTAVLHTQTHYSCVL